MAHTGLLRCSRSMRVISSRYFNGLRCISTSGKNRETCATTIEKAQTCETTETQSKKNWMSYGFDIEDEEEDRNFMNSTMFGSITLCMVIGGFIWAYMPEIKMRDWAQREAFLELRRRESRGLPLIDRNLIDPAKVHLPPESELEDVEVII